VLRNRIDAAVHRAGGARLRKALRDHVESPVDAAVSPVVREVAEDIRRTDASTLAELRDVADPAAAFAELERVRAMMSFDGPGQFHASWLACCDFAARELRVRVDGLEPLVALGECGAWWALKDAAILSERPVAFGQDRAGRLHGESGPALAYPDGFALWRWHGLRVPRRVILGQFGVPDIEGERNLEIRRAMIERYGAARYIVDSRARLVHADGFGELYCKRFENGEPLMMVKVINATAEADGSRREFFLRVPPHMRRARQAVAWTFAMEERQYRPAAES
jgi:hypothetical protein